MASDVEDLRQRLDAISAELAEMAIDRLRAALDGAGGDPSGEERRLTRARRAVDKASALLRQDDEV